MPTIRTLESIEDLKQAEAIQRDIWNIHDSTWVLPVHLLLTAQKNGGLVAAAFDDKDVMVGFVFGFLGLREDGLPKHCSHLMGVIPHVRRSGVGEALKRFQREYVLSQGLTLATWTFDPLEGLNAMLNIAKLGSISRTYYPDHYGDTMTDALNVGLPTDRFEVEWWLDSPHVLAYLEADREQPTRHTLVDAGAELVIDAQLDSDGMAHPLEVHVERGADVLLIEIPAEFQAIKTVSMAVARQWRLATRLAFTHYFDQDYIITDFISDRDDVRRRNFYVLTRD